MLCLSVFIVVLKLVFDLFNEILWVLFRKLGFVCGSVSSLIRLL